MAKLPEIIELTGHPWFIGVQFHPELLSRPLNLILYLILLMREFKERI